MFRCVLVAVRYLLFVVRCVPAGCLLSVDSYVFLVAPNVLYVVADCLLIIDCFVAACCLLCVMCCLLFFIV